MFSISSRDEYLRFFISMGMRNGTTRGYTPAMIPSSGSSFIIIVAEDVGTRKEQEVVSVTVTSADDYPMFLPKQRRTVSDERRTV
jgi:hypothetical protein